MLLSPQHRLLVNRKSVEQDAPFHETFLSAKLLAEIDNTCKALTRVNGAVTYVHLMTEKHQVIYAEGIATETFWPGPEAIRGLSVQNMKELLELFPELALAYASKGPQGRRHASKAYGDLARHSLKRRDLLHLRAARRLPKTNRIRMSS